MSRDDVIAGYEVEAADLAPQFLALSSAEIFAPFAAHLPKAPGHVLDIGAGPGRDAAYFAELGHRVTAVEPVSAFRDIGASQVPEARWIDDVLPDLDRVSAMDERYQLILLCAVLHHLDDDGRSGTLRTVRALCADDARVIVSLKHFDEGKAAAEDDRLASAADATGFDCLARTGAPSHQGANQGLGDNWTWFVLRPDPSKGTPLR